MTSTSSRTLLTGLAALCCAAAPGLSLAAAPYTQTWSGASSEGWEGNTTSSVVVFDGGIGNPAGSIATRRSLEPPVFDIGATSGTVAATSGSFSGTVWTVSFDLQLNEGKFSDVWLRYRYQDFTFNGWRYAFAGPFEDYNTWTNYSVTFNADWSDADAIANGWTQDNAPAVSFATTMGNAYRTEIRLALTDSTESAIAHIDNFIQTPVPEPGTWALMLAGLGMLVGVSRRRITRAA